jgi:hypothetical protein
MPLHVVLRMPKDTKRVTSPAVSQVKVVEPAVGFAKVPPLV